MKFRYAGWLGKRASDTAQSLAATAACWTAALIAAPSVVGAPALWRAIGHEPSWSLSRSGGEMTLETDFGANRISFAVPPATKADDGSLVYAASINGEALHLTVKPSVCVDTMTGMPRPETVTVSLGTKTYSGCGGDPSSLLLGREWTVASLAGQRALPKPNITMTFSQDGQISGLGSCNRYNATYTLTGEGLLIGKGMSSMMACDEPVMRQEQLFFELIERVSRFSIAADGGLVLHADGDRTIETMKP